MIADYQRWTALEMAEKVARREVAAHELREACLALIAEHEPRLNAVAERRAVTGYDASGPFAGVPFAVKELLAMPGLHWTLASRLLARNAVAEASPYAQRILGSGLDVICSTTASEFGLLGSTESLLHGPTGNPWGEGLSPAGSSGGSAALVAAGVFPMAHANDGGGSIRVPASVTGLFGFKPSNDRNVPSAPREGLAALVIDHVVSRSVADSAAFLAVTGPPVERPGRRPLRVGVIERTLLGALPDPAVLDALNASRRLLEDLGHTTEDAGPAPVSGRGLSDAFFTLAGVTLAGVAAMLGRDPGPDELEPFSLELLAHARANPLDVTDVLPAAAAAYNRRFETYDVLLSPTLARPPWQTGHLHPALGREELIRRTEAIVGYTPIHNVAGGPAMSVPLGEAGGLPVGIHFAAAPGADALLLELAFELEQAAPWRHRRPGLATLA